MATEKLTRPNQSSEKLLTVMEVLAKQESPIKLQELSKQLDMNPSTVFRFLVSLQNKGYVTQDEKNGNYYLTYKLCGLANQIASHIDLRYIVSPYLRIVSNLFGESANLTIEQDMKIVYIEVVNSNRQIVSTLQRIGNIAPMHCTGAGKLMLLNYSKDQLEDLVEKQGLQKFTDNTITKFPVLLRELDNARINGYAFDNEECEIGARCVAVPLRNYENKVIACISVSGPTTRMTDALIYEHLSQLIEVSENISRKLGYQAY